MLFRSAAPGTREYLEQKFTPELSMFWRDEDVHPEVAVDCKLRADGAIKGFGFFDIKTTSDASRDGFGRSTANLLYHVQAAHYLSGARLKQPDARFVFLAVESEAPYAVGAYELGEASLIAGYTIREEVIRRIVDTEAREQWRGYSAGLKTERLDLPAWALRSAGLV